MKFRLPAKIALLIVNAFVITFLLLFIYLIGFTASSDTLTVNIIGIKSDQDYFSWIFNKENEVFLLSDQLDTINIGFFDFLFYAVASTSYINEAQTDIVINTAIVWYALMGYFILIAGILFSINTVLSLLNLLIWKKVKLAKTVDVFVKLFTVIAIGLLIYAYITIKMFFEKNLLVDPRDENNYLDPAKPYTFIDNSNFIMLIFGVIFPFIMLIVHSILNRPLYKKV
ncbi:hypothetical protein [Spiroplasma culicicola]|nr:hypothetical protein [Spiroplasma culicicola]